MLAVGYNDVEPLPLEPVRVWDLVQVVAHTELWGLFTVMRR